MLGQDPRLWFATLAAGPRARSSPRRKRPPSPPAPRRPARRRGRPGIAAPGEARRAGAAETEPSATQANEIRIACIDIGGGTTDLMIAKYNFESKIDDSIRGQVLHQDGISLGGDQLVKRLLEVDHRPPLRRRPRPGGRGRAVALRAGSAAEPRDPRPARQLRSTASSSPWPRPT